MQPYENKVMLKLIKLDPATRSTFEKSSGELKVARVANPPGAGNLRKLKKQAEKEAMAQLYQTLNATQANRKYDQIYARMKGITTRD